MSSSVWALCGVKSLVGADHTAQLHAVVGEVSACHEGLEGLDLGSVWYAPTISPPPVIACPLLASIGGVMKAQTSPSGATTVPSGQFEAWKFAWWCMAHCAVQDRLTGLCESGGQDRADVTKAGVDVLIVLERCHRPYQRH